MRKTRRANPKRGQDVNMGGSTERLSSVAQDGPKLSIGERVGGAIRHIRLERRLRLGDVASAAGISVSMLSRFETGRSTASLLLLERICTALGVDLSTLFSRIEQSRGDAQFIKATQLLEVVRPGTKHGYTYRLLSCRTRKSFEPFLIDMDKRSKSHPRFQHGGTEFIYMLSGRMHYRLEDKTLLLESGDAITFPGRVRHGPEKLLSNSIQLITMIVYAE
ncbi:helix-turn-helix domain-containing protein [Bradyrhizobium sp. DASA03076]|uniref:helix-turn-helix domain-containing protein n=1 Tax=Bradyrhizobium sp. BLXBL-03 TaxID=3395916 RepID=UPI003F7096C2